MSSTQLFAVTLENPKDLIRATIKVRAKNADDATTKALESLAGSRYLHAYTKLAETDPVPAPAAAPACCCGTVAPTMPAVLSMPTAAELASIAADAAGLGRSLATLAGELASMASVARMPSTAEVLALQQMGALHTEASDRLHVGAVASLDSVAKMPARETLSAQSAAAAAGRSPRYNSSKGGRLTQSALVAEIVRETIKNGKDAATAAFDNYCSQYNLTQVEAYAVAKRVRLDLAKQRAETTEAAAPVRMHDE